MEGYKNRAIVQIREKVGGGKVLLALSGGVDSSVAAALLAEAVGNQLTCVFVDHGLMRKDEGDEVEAAFSRWDIHFVRVDAEARFLGQACWSVRPGDQAEDHRRGVHPRLRGRGQAAGSGGLSWSRAPSIPTSSSPALATPPSSRATTMSGVCLTMWTSGRSLSPCACSLRMRSDSWAGSWGLPEYLVMRQPFPGPGLAIRVIGDITKEKLDILREADFIFREEIAKAHLEGSMNQYFAVLTSMRSVGVMGDGRTYDYTLALRSVTTTDFMTADWTRIPYEVLDRVSVRIVNEVPHINRIVYDITSKPPATIEWE